MGKLSEALMLKNTQSNYVPVGGLYDNFMKGRTDSQQIRGREATIQNSQSRTALNEQYLMNAQQKSAILEQKNQDSEALKQAHADIMREVSAEVDPNSKTFLQDYRDAYMRKAVRSGHPDLAKGALDMYDKTTKDKNATRKAEIQLRTEAEKARRATAEANKAEAEAKGEGKPKAPTNAEWISMYRIARDRVKVSEADTMYMSGDEARARKAEWDSFPSFAEWKKQEESRMASEAGSSGGSAKAKKSYEEGTIIKNSKTGERMVMKGGKWQPVK